VELLDLDPVARERRLNEACGDDDALRAEVIELLEAAASAGAFLDTPALELARESLVSPDASLPGRELGGRTLGGSILHEELGRGGMGVVYRATQQSPERVVAVKVTPCTLSLSARRRFERESRALGRMQHPSIATIFEAGVETATGLAWIAMEFVEGGRPITTFVRETGASLDERLRLFRDACDAVHHGHLRGVIHRDLKPSNILVGRDGRVKVIDFGIARLLGPDDTNATLTHEASPIGTLGSMSPEQCGGEPVDLRSDVYAMGVVLHEMIAGAPPFDLQGRSLETALRTIRTMPPPPLRRIVRTVPRDIETIVLTALEKDASRRYQSVAALADDVQRFREHRPIEARPAGWPHHLALFARRHVALAIATAAIVAVLIAATVVSLRFAVDADRERVAAVRVTYAAILASANAAYDAHEIHRLRERLTLAPTALRGWEWRFLERQARSAQTVFERHEQGVTSVAWSPTEDCIVSVDMAGMLRCWRADGSEAAEPIDLGKPAFAVAWSGDGRLLAAAAMLTPIRLFRVERSGDAFRLSELDRSFPLLAGGVSAVDLNHDGSLLVYAGERGASIWRTEDGSRIGTVDARGALRAARFAPDGARIALARESTIEIRGALDGSLLSAIEHGPEFVDALAWSPDGETIASARQDGRVALHRVSDGMQLRSTQAHARAARAVLVSADGAHVLSAGDDHRIVVWSASDLSERRVLAGHFDSIASLSLRADGGALVSGSADGTARVWGLERDDAMRRSIGPRWRPTVGALVHAGDTRLLAANEFGSLEMLDAETWRPEVIREGNGVGYRHAAASPTGERIAISHGPSSLLLLDAATGNELARVTHGDEGGPTRVLARSVSAVTFAPDGERVATGGGDAAIRIYRLERGPDGERLTLERVITGGVGAHGGEVTALRFAPDGGTLYAASIERMLAAWDLRTGTRKWTSFAHTDAILSLAVHPQDGTIVSGGRDQRLVRYAPADGRVLATLEGHGQAISALAFLPDGSRLVTGSLFGDLRLWNWPRCEELLTLRATEIGSVRSLSIDRSGNEIVAGGRGGITRWRCDRLRSLRSPAADPTPIRSE
jgi:WD40 repeat protein